MQKAILWGCGQYGEQAYPIVSKQYDIVALCDNNAKLWGTIPTWSSLPNVEIIPPNEIVPRFGSDVVALICISNGYPDVAQQLNCMGIVSHKVVYNGIIMDFDFSRGLCFSEYYRNLDIVPKQLSVCLSSVCNIKCQYCNFHSQYSTLEWHKGTMSLETARNIKLPNTIKMQKVAFVGAGEPMMNTHWYEIAEDLLDRFNFPEMHINTNGLLLNEENIKNLIKLSCEKITVEVSLDGLSWEESEYWRVGSNYKRIYENVNLAQSLFDDRFHILISSAVVLPSGIHKNLQDVIKTTLQKAKKYWKTEFPLADVQAHLAYPYPYALPPKCEVVEWFDIAGSLCTNHQHVVFINFDGSILICPNLSDEYAIGNVNSDVLYDVWLNNSRLNRARNEMKNDKRPEECFEGCQNMPHSKRKALIKKTTEIL